MATVLERLVEAVRKSADYNSAAEVAPSCILWTDGDRQFEEAFLLRCAGYEPTALSERERNALLLRMVPLVERNYNMVEIGPRGTGKSHLFQQITPYAHLISGGRPTVPQLFVNNGTGQRGLVCHYDVVCFDEITGITRSVPREQKTRASAREARAGMKNRETPARLALTAYLTIW